MAVAEHADLRSLRDRGTFALPQAEGRVVVARDRADYLQIERENRPAGTSMQASCWSSPALRRRRSDPVVKALEQLFPGDAPYPGFVHRL